MTTNLTTTDGANYFEENFKFLLEFSDSYGEKHGWIAASISSFGILFNILNLIILNRKKLSKSIVNKILIAIAFCDSITMIVYLPYCIHFYILNTNTISFEFNLERDTLFWTVYSMISTLVCLTSHSISIWLTVYLAIYRYLSIVQTKIQNSNNNILVKRPKLVIFLIALFNMFCCLPTYLYPKVCSITLRSNSRLVYYIDQSDLNILSENLIFKISFYSQAICGKIVPCILLGIFIALISKCLLKIKQNRQKLLASSKVNCHIKFNFLYL